VIKISKVHYLELDSNGTLIEEGSSLDLEITAFDWERN